MSVKKVSAFDKECFKKIRKNVERLIKEASLKYNKKSFLVLDIGPQSYDNVKKYFNKAKVETLAIEGGDQIDYQADITKNNSRLIKGGRYDVVICTEVLEHTANPFQAVKEISRIMKKGAILVLSVPFNFRIHGPLPDCWRFTEHGLKILLADFKIIKLQSIETKGRGLMPIHYTIIAKK